MGYIFDTPLFYVVALAASVLAVVYVYFKKSFSYWKNRNVPYVEPIFPAGNFAEALLLRKTIGQVHQSSYRKLEGKKYGGIYSFTEPRFLLRDPDIIKTVLVKDFQSFHDHGLFRDEDLEPLLGHLFLIGGSRWKNLRAKLTPTFSSGKMKMMFQTFVECGQELGSTLEKSASNEEVIEIKDIMARYSTDIISSCAFGIQCNCLKNPEAEFRQWGRKFFAPSFRNAATAFLNETIPNLMGLLKVTPIDPKIARYFQSMVEDTVNYRERNNITRNDFLQLLIQIKNKVKVDDENEIPEMNGSGSLEDKFNEDVLTMNNLAAQVFVFFFGGFETSSTTITFCLYELAMHQDIQDRLRREIDVELQKHDGKLTYEGIQEMEYLDKVVSETLRKYPPSPRLIRECTKDYKIPGTDVVLEKGIKTIVPIMALHHDPKYYPDPERFDPERFNENEKKKRHHYVYLPFGEGPRICIGRRFGLLQTKVGVVSLISKFQFNVCKKTPIPLVLDPKSFIMASSGGMWLQIGKRVK
jgi:cytochrome P450 family 6